MNQKQEPNPSTRKSSNEIRRRFDRTLDILDSNRSSKLSRNINTFIKSRTFTKREGKSPNPLVVFLYPLSLSSFLLHKWYTVIPYKSMKSTFKPGIFAGRKRTLSFVRKAVSYALKSGDSVFLASLSEYFSNLRYIYSNRQYNEDILPLETLSFKLMKKEVQQNFGIDLEDMRKSIISLIDNDEKRKAEKLMRKHISSLLKSFRGKFPEMKKQLSSIEREIEDSSVKSTHAALTRLYMGFMRSYLEISLKEQRKHEAGSSLRSSKIKEKQKIRQLALLSFSLYYLYANYLYFSAKAKKHKLDVSNPEEPVRKRKNYAQIISRFIKSKMFKYVAFPLLVTLLSLYGIGYFLTSRWQSVLRNNQFQREKKENLYVPVPKKAKEEYGNYISTYSTLHYRTISIERHSLISILNVLRASNILNAETQSFLLRLDSEIRNEKDYHKRTILENYRDDLMMLLFIIYTKNNSAPQEKELFKIVLANTEKFMNMRHRIRTPERLNLVLTNIISSSDMLVSSYDTRLIKALYKKIEGMPLQENERMKLIYFIREKRRDAQGTLELFESYLSNASNAFSNALVN